MTPDRQTSRHPAGRVARRRRVVAAGVAGALVVALVAAAAALRGGGPAPPAPLCVATGSGGRFGLDLSQAANAATIAAVGKRDGLPDHAVTVALVAALQESKLHNLAGGDRDSVGLFQQRPSQGWGPRSQLIVPRLAAARFYRALVLVPGWADIGVGDAAQRVQRSGAPEAYAPWEQEGRALAEVLTGEVPAGLACRFTLPRRPTAGTTLGAAMTAELGSAPLGRTVAEAPGWTTAAWLVAHAYAYRIPSVTFLGRRWTPAAGTWEPQLPAVSQVEVGSPGE